MRLLIFLSAILFSACSDATNKIASTTDTEICDINFHTTEPCVYKNIKVKILTSVVESDEKTMQALDVVFKSNKYRLNIIPDTSILDGDRGYISFTDINFDGTPDIAITTSFGLANLYLDYWVYDTSKKQYSYLGNYAKFNLDTKNKTLSNVIKINAAKYENNTYKWQGLSLVKE